MKASREFAEPVVQRAFNKMREAELDLAEHAADFAGQMASKMTPIEQVVYFTLVRVARQDVDFHSQYQIGRYTADFVVILNAAQDVKQPPIIVECDGHDFHEKTKEQAQHDKKRDRELQRLGYKVYRFTGSEIFRTCGACVLEALGLEDL